MGYPTTMIRNRPLTGYYLHRLSLRQEEILRKMTHPLEASRIFLDHGPSGYFTPEPQTIDVYWYFVGYPTQPRPAVPHESVYLCRVSIYEFSLKIGRTSVKKRSMVRKHTKLTYPRSRDLSSALLSESIDRATRLRLFKAEKLYEKPSDFHKDLLWNLSQAERVLHCAALLT